VLVTFVQGSVDGFGRLGQDLEERSYPDLLR
jgi:hypothetical protein